MILSFAWAPRPGPFLQLLFLLGVTLCAIVLWRRGRAEGSLPGRLLWAAAPVLVAWAGAVVLSLSASGNLGVAYAFENNVFLVSSALLVTLPLMALPTRFRAVGGFFLLFAAALVALGDAIYMRAFSGILSPEAAGAAGQVPDVLRSIAALLRIEDLWMLVVPASTLAFAVVMWKLPMVPPPPWGWRLLAAVLMMACATPALWRLGGEETSVRGLPLALSDAELIRANGLLGAHLLELTRSVRDRLGSKWSSEAAVRARAFFDRPRAAPDPEWFGAAKGDNLVLVQVEALQDWVIGLVINGQPVTPFLDSMRSRAIEFTQIYDQTKDGRTSDAEFAVLNSLHPLERGSVAFRRAGNHFLALPSILKSHGYVTVSAHANEPGFWNRGVLHPKYGFDRLLFRGELGTGQILGWGLPDADLFERVTATLPTQQPFLAFLVTVTSHHPFDYLPREMKELSLGELEGTPVGNYLQSVRYVDGALRHLFERLEQRGLLDSTVVAIYGDHDAGFEYTDLLRKVAGISAWTDATRIQFDRVPFMIWLPKAARTGRFDQPGGHVDIAPTLLRLLGIPTPRCFAGSPLPSRTPAPVFSPMGAAIRGDRMAILDARRCVHLPDGEPASGACDFVEAAEAPVVASRYLTEQDAYQVLGCDDAPTGQPPATWASGEDQVDVTATR
ncbi:MAG: LTA synthase family protein [Myxococcaceae bacterium]|nr:LTA synthase family protein [Myxococcaceae bacterium]